MTLSFLFTCEHAGNTVPSEYSYLFKGSEELLYSHKGIDHGALRLAKHITSQTHDPLYYTTITRALVETNRSPDNEELFSEISKDAPKSVKQDILEKYYYPHRRKIEAQIRDLISHGYQVIHFSIHTFAPVFEGEVRDTDIGVLYDPKKVSERNLAVILKEEFLKQNPIRNVHLNSPYPGTEDCFPKFLKNVFPEEQYLGFELEINQKFYLTGEAEVWETLVDELTNAILVIKKKCL